MPPRPAKRRDPRRPDAVDIMVGRNVRVWRIAKGMSQSKLGDRLGVTFQQVQKYEKGGTRISTGRLVRLSRSLEIPLSALFKGADEGNETLATLALFDDRRAHRLASAFAAIPETNRKVRLALVEIVEQIAASLPRQSEKRRFK
jgi:transcriptional regulator with XRE-family HTH domain